MFASNDDLAQYESAMASEAGYLLQQSGVKLVILNSCNSARAGTYLNANLAAELVKSGIPIVVRMSFEFTVSAAQVFIKGFYQAFLATQASVLVATKQARQALTVSKERLARFRHKIEIQDWIIPVLYRGIGKDLDDSTNVIGGLSTTELDVNSHDPSFSIYSLGLLPPTIGGDYDIFRLESCLAQKKAIKPRGELGGGESTFLRRAVYWWKLTRFIYHVVILDCCQFGFSN
jgi:hypothetical protein